MTNTLLFDLARVFLFTKDKSYKGELNSLHRTLSGKPDYKFSDYFYFNEELFGITEKLKLKTELYMFTSGTIQEVPDVQYKINGFFKEVFSAEKLGLSKKDPNAYLEIVAKIGKPQEDIVFIDDARENILAAQEANLKTILYGGNFQLIQELKNHIKFTI